ncbi:alpha/beta fold hydrolase [Bradyrhizobium commune]|uniref:Alpha/beta hydrolase n=1 Tax=Bradyrhizobium commune TaxID=83627 RepID=A0A7S9DCI8_9BRAD|nr:alpha/beta hydrolase [Bradyrhizobium commune]QPF95304.1 alpha/beta hydrolase [Bradyrhizobium commune]
MVTVAHNPPRIAKANGIDICYDTFGDAQSEPLVLIMGLAGQMVQWDDAFCVRLAARGFRVVRFDNRDSGKSSKLPGKRLTWWEALKALVLHMPPAASYTLRDMARDTIALMDVLGIRSAHIVGASMGGMIAQEIAIAFPKRVRSLISISSTTGNPDLPQPSAKAIALLSDPQPTDREKFIARFKRMWKVLRAGRFPEDEALDRSRAELVYDRGVNPVGVDRQIRAVLASGSRKELLRTVKAPTLVIHGTADPLVDPKAAQDTAASIPGAKLMLVAGMGHALPIRMWPQIIDAIDKHAHQASAIAARVA